MDKLNMLHNCAIERTADAGHKACEASFAPKAHRSPHSAVGDARRSAHRRRYALRKAMHALLIAKVISIK